MKFVFAICHIFKKYRFELLAKEKSYLFPTLLVQYIFNDLSDEFMKSFKRNLSIKVALETEIMLHLLFVC